ncbi:MAG: SpoIIE family protein phosphatase [Planctomycetota bacterium]|jgi:sigma-B regulation protein RsbU (phosphoserine phosphatase)
MTIRKKLMILLLSVSLIPLVAYFILDISFSRIVRKRVEKSLRTAVADRAAFTLVETIDHYQEQIRISAQAVRYSLRHYADLVNRILWSINIDTEKLSAPNYLIQTSLMDISAETRKYQSMDIAGTRKLTIDFDSELIYPPVSESGNLLRSGLPQLTKECKTIYSINPEMKLWIYTVTTDGTSGLYPSCGFWPYEEGYDLRQESWYINTKSSNQFTLTQRIEPLTSKTVMTVAVPLFEKDGSFAGAVAMDIDLSGMLDRIQIPEEWQAGAWKLLIGLPEQQELDIDEAEVICCNSFLQSQGGPGEAARLVDICDSQEVAKMIENSRHGNTGFIRQPYDGIDSLWIYGSSYRRGGFPILVVPYQRIVEQANNAQRLLFQDNIRAIQVVTVLIFTAIVAAVVLAVMRARNFTVPITHLADAAGKLASGDFEVTVNISTNDELQKLGDVFNQVGPGMKERQKIKQSLELAGEIQQHFLPTEDLELDNFQVAGLCRYCDETGGDYYDLLDLRAVAPGKVGLVLGDVSGHGIPAAMLMISSGSILRNNAPRHGDDLSAAITELNRHLVINSEPGKFMTLFYGMLDEKSKTLSWASAGHDPAIWYHAESGKFTEMENTGMPLGVIDDPQFGQAEPVTLCAGDVVVIGTDGIWEACNASRQMYGKERLFDLISLHKDKSARQIASLVVESVLEFCSDTPPADDITLLVIKCTE